MWTIQITEQPETEPVTVEELSDHLRLNDDSEETLLEMYIKVARQLFEAQTGRAIHPTTFRQYVQCVHETIPLMRGPVTAISAVKYRNSEGTYSDATYTSDIISSPATIRLDPIPNVHAYLSPSAYIEFVAGWAEDAVPEMVKLAIMLLAGHYYANRESHADVVLSGVPMGWQSIVDLYRLGLIGNWRL